MLNVFLINAVNAAEGTKLQQLKEKRLQEEWQTETEMQPANNALENESEKEENSIEKAEDGGYLTQSDDGDNGALLNEDDDDEAMEYSNDNAVDQSRCRYRNKCTRGGPVNYLMSCTHDIPSE